MYNKYIHKNAQTDNQDQDYNATPLTFPPFFGSAETHKVAAAYTINVGQCCSDRRLLNVYHIYDIYQQTCEEMLNKKL